MNRILAWLKGSGEPDVASCSQWQLIAHRFRRHGLARVALYVILAFYFVAIFTEFFCTNDPGMKHPESIHSPPMTPRLSLSEGLHAFRVAQHTDPITLRKDYVTDRKDVVPLGFFVKGDPYRLWGLIPCERRFFGVDQDAYRRRRRSAGLPPAAVPRLYLLGADRIGRDVYSRLITGTRVSLSIGLVAIIISFALGITVGGISGYCGGWVDVVIQRVIEIVKAFPKLPLWLALGFALPRTWSSLQVYFGITLILSLMGWTSLARVVRGRMLSLREEDYAVAARLLGAGHGRIIFRHLLPGFTSHITVSLTMTVPRMILGETSLSFLGLGLKAPAVSWGVMLRDCMSMQTVKNYPWLLMPVVLIVVAVLSFNFIGDGLRDAADPYATG